MEQTIQRDLSELDALIERFDRGIISISEVCCGGTHFGIYPQREPGKFFVRVRILCGMLSPSHLERLAQVAQTWGAHRCHLTTRQCVEIQGLALSDIVAALGALASAGLDTHETGGATVRNIVLCPHAGTGHDEPFDVLPFAAWLAHHLLRNPDYQNLPRKIKIGMSCCREDCARTRIQDIGFQACVDASGESPGFRVVVGGGLGVSPRFGRTLIEFVPAVDILLVADAILRVFNALGDRENRKQGRLKFLVESLGLEAFRSTVIQELDRLRKSRPSYPPLRPLPHTPCRESELQQAAESTLLDDGNFQHWTKTFVVAQKDGESRMIRLPIPGGNITAGQLKMLAALARDHGLDIRITPEQSVRILGARPEVLEDIYRRISQSGLDPVSMAGIFVACPGSSSCTNAFTNCKGLCEAALSRLQASGVFPEDMGGLRIKISGCMNGCSQHAVADIGLEGIALRKGHAWIPAYRVWLGGSADQERVHFGQRIGMIPSQRVPEFLTDIVAYYERQRADSESFGEVLERVGIQSFCSLLEKHTGSFAAQEGELGRDWGEEKPYRPMHRGPSTFCG